MADTADRSIDALTEALAQRAYLADRGLATVLHVALALEKPLLLEGEAGVGKTEVAKALAEVLEARLIRLQCYEGIDVAHALYDWSYARQMLSIRLIEARDGGGADAPRPVRAGVPGAAAAALRPSSTAIRGHRCSWWTRSTVPTTSSRRSCSSCSRTSRSPSPRSGRSGPSGGRWSSSPRTARASCTTPSSGAASTTGSGTRPSTARSPSCAPACPASPSAWPARPRRSSARLRELDLAKVPGVAETIDWAQALAALGEQELDAGVVDATLGAVLKYHEDLERVRDRGLKELVAEATAETRLAAAT